MLRRKCQRPGICHLNDTKPTESRLADFSDRFPFRLKPIFEVVSNHSAPGAMNLVSAMQDFFNVQAFVDYIFIEDFVFHFNSHCDFAYRMHIEVASHQHSLPQHFPRQVFL